MSMSTGSAAAFESNSEAAGGGDEAGFTLVETLVAFTIAALLLASLFPAFSGALRGTARAESEYRAVLWAESLIDAIGQSIPLQPGETSGMIDETTGWRARVRELAAAPAIAAGRDLIAYEVTVEVGVESAAGPARVSLTTVRLAMRGS